MTTYAGVVRDEAGLRTGLSELADLEVRMKDIGVHPDIAGFQDLAHAFERKHGRGGCDRSHPHPRDHHHDTEVQAMTTTANSAVPATPPPATPRPAGRVLDTVQWIFVGLAVTTAILLPLTGVNALFVTLLLTIPFAAVHGIRRYGWRRFLAFFAVTFVVSNAFENLSIVTGFPFGNYHYTGDPKLLHVPIFIGPIYFGLGYLSWLTASTVLDRADERLDWRERTGKVNVVALPALAAAVMTMFDVASDSQAATVIEMWTWHDGGGVFGVPYTNYLGWWLVTYIFFQTFALILAPPQTRDSQPTTVVVPGSLTQPVLIYAALGLTSIPYFFTAEPGTVIDMTGTPWSISAINETMMTINIFTVVTVALLALTKIARGDTAP